MANIYQQTVSGTVDYLNDQAGANQDERRNSQLGLRGLHEAYQEAQQKPEGAEAAEGFVGETKEFGKNLKEGDFKAAGEKIAGKVIDRLPFRWSIALVGACILPVFIVGILSQYRRGLELDYDIQIATGLSLGISLLDVLKERVVTLTNHNLQELHIPGHDHFQIGRELTFVWAWIPLSWGTMHFASTIGILLEFCLAAAQTMISAIKIEDVLEGWAKGFTIAGLAAAVPALIYCFVFDKVTETPEKLPVKRNMFSMLNESTFGRFFLKGLGFAMQYQKEIAQKAGGVISGAGFGSHVEALEKAMDDIGDDEDINFDDETKWEKVTEKADIENGAIPVFIKRDSEGTLSSKVPDPKSLIALAMPVLGILGALGSVILHSILYHDIYVDDPKDKIIRGGDAIGLDISEHALSGAQLMAVVSWMALSIVAGLAYTDLEMKRAFGEITIKDRAKRKGFEWVKQIPERLQNRGQWKRQIDEAYKYPSNEEFKDMSDNPIGVVEGIPRIFAGDFFSPFNPRLLLAAIMGNFAKYFIVCRALVFATFDNNDQGFLLSYVVPESVAVIIMIIYFYTESAACMVYVRGKPDYVRSKITREIEIPQIDRPLQLWREQTPGGGVMPMVGYNRGPVVPNMRMGENYEAVPGVPLPMSVYAPSQDPGATSPPMDPRAMGQAPVNGSQPPIDPRFFSQGGVPPTIPPTYFQGAPPSYFPGGVM